MSRTFRYSGTLWIRRSFAVVLLALLAGSEVNLYADPARADNVRLIQAGFISKFPLFIEWPEGRGAGPNQPLVIGVLGETPITSYLTQIAAERPVNNYSVVVREISDPIEARSAHVLFIPPKNSSRLQKVVQALTGYSVLVVTDGPGLGEQGAMINFFLERDRVRFEINLEAVKAAQLQVSFRLEQVGVPVGKRRGDRHED